MQAALDAAVAKDAAAESGEQARFAPSEDTPAGPEQPAAVQPDETSEAPAPESPVEDTDPFSEKFNPDTLPEELQPGWKQLQAAFTKRTQEVAEQRRQIEALGDLNDVQQAVGLMQRIQDPSTWPQLHAELTEAMRQAGLNEPAADAPQPQEPAVPSADDLDPDIAPLKSQLDQVTQKLQAIEAREREALQAEQAQLQRERQQMQFLQQIQEQEDVIREANPHYKQKHIDAIYDLAPAFGGDLIAAEQRFAALMSDAKAELFAQKQSVVEKKAVQPVPDGGVSQKREAPATLEAAAAEAEELVRQMQAAGELDLTGF